MKKHTYYYFIALALLLPLISWAQSDYARDCKSCYECLENAVNSCAFDVQVQAGIVPISWKNRGFVYGNNCDILPPSAAFFQIPHFNDFYKLPWSVGGQIGYGLDCNARVFVEFNYAQAKEKCSVIPTFSRTVGLSVSKYKYFDGYAGVRYYTDRSCNRTAFFMGAKVGFVHHKTTYFDATLISQIPPVVLAPRAPATALFIKNTVISGGGHLGADICLWANLSLVLTAEIVASCGPRGNSLVVVSPVALGVNSLIIYGVGTELRFPVTLGLRYSF